tara:strand:+ start:43810 stop:45852 length:2043 start_codon:yes stop_codon:yes gene_type:complete
MNFLKILNQFQGVFKWSSFIITFFIMVICFSNLSSYDVYWHLHMGLDFIEKGLSLFKDHVSIDFRGEEVSNSSWLFQIFLALFYKIDGSFLGLYIFKSLIFGSILLLLIYFGRVRKWDWGFVFVAVLLVAMSIANRRMLRPENLSYVFFLIFTFQYLSIASEFSRKKLWGMIAVLVVWWNFHSSVLFGLVIIAGVLAQRFIFCIHNKKYNLIFKEVLFFGIVANLVMFIHPLMTHPALGLAETTDKWYTIITEYRPLSIEKNRLEHFVSMTVMLSVPVISLVRKRLDLFFISGIIMVQTVVKFKLYPYFMIFNTIFLVDWLFTKKNLATSLLRERNKKAISILGVFLLFIGYNAVLMVYGLYGYFSHSSEFDRSQYKYKFPVEIVQTMKNNGWKGPIFNNYNAGGYLGFAFRGESPILIDGRSNILYPYEYYEELVNAGSHVFLFRDYVVKRNIQYIITGMSYSDLLMDTALKSGYYSIEMIDSTNILLTRNAIQFPIFTLLLVKPYCLDPKHKEALMRERELALSKDYQVMGEVFDYILAYLESEDPKAFIHQQVSWKKVAIQRLRLYFAFLNNELGLMLRISAGSPLPRLLALKLSRKLAMDNDPMGAAEVLSRARPPQGAGPLEQFSFLEQMKWLNSKFENLIDSSKIEKLEKLTQQYSFSGDGASARYLSCDRYVY